MIFGGWKPGSISNLQQPDWQYNKTVIFWILSGSVLDDCAPVFWKSFIRCKPKVEKDQKCQEYLLAAFPNTCLFPDVFDLTDHKFPKNRIEKPSAIKFKKAAMCVTHGQNCHFEINDGDMIVLGPPCIIFSKLVGWVHQLFCVFGRTRSPPKKKHPINTLSHQLSTSCGFKSTR